MIGLGIGPGDEVLVPAHTYMASATSVLAAGAIPVIVDVNESITIDPAALEAGHRAAHARGDRGTTCGAPPVTWTRSWKSRAVGKSW